MSNSGNNVPTTSDSQVDSTKYNSSKVADPETASIATFSSSAPLLQKDQKEKNGTEIDAKKLQEQALRSQIRFSM
ncbi:hypothetical protein H9Q69_000362 [Fusarium xylarioides]|uniref:Uncharacterized protein n=2 Tax=Fusarium fujikuroi species complex TaxID=171627 RepID=A0A9P7IGH2_9HYPO|nr:hypothetical protein FPHYL_2262 [Fusarium phyllophilum]KAG5746599.1 hypothetical protein H9Q70_010709 [Fusarium xylarioides]KAG5771956.1 hypothetical protein H9Q72_001690 [Fusarium xylarioides]KAG5775810.1 hypothetical protein H9Q73_010529 [Fusarium xylarioides]KAG5800631.1 hypothetical protein H9Q69_000362 [Fusarium xylarioides]